MRPAATGSEGRSLARDGPWHLLVINVNSPDLDGFTLCRTLRDGGDVRHHFGLRVEMQNDLAAARRFSTALPLYRERCHFVAR